MIYHAVLMSDEIEGVFPANPFDVEPEWKFPEVKDVCGRSVTGYQAILLEGWNCHIPLNRPPEVERGTPTICIECGVELFNRIGTEDLYPAENLERWRGTKFGYY